MDWVEGNGTKRRQLMIELIASRLDELGGMLVVPFGSFVTGTDIEESDVDVSVIFLDHIGFMSTPQRSERLDILFKFLESRFAHIVCNRSGRFPTIRLNHRLLGVPTTGDLVIHDAHAVISTWVLFSILEAADEITRRSIILPVLRRVREWIRRNELCGSSSGNHPAIVFIYMIISFFQFKYFLGRVEYVPGSMLGIEKVDEGALIELAKSGYEECKVRWGIKPPLKEPHSIVNLDVLFRECLEFICFHVDGIFPGAINITTTNFPFRQRGGSSDISLVVLDPLDGRNIVRSLSRNAQAKLINELNFEIQKCYIDLATKTKEFS